MGTRSLVEFQEFDGTVLCTVYRQFDGYPDGMGLDLCEIIGDGRLKNGFGMDDVIPQTFNGMGCLTAYVIGKLKGNAIGNVYIEKPGVRNIGEEYVYIIKPDSDPKPGKIAKPTISMGEFSSTIPEFIAKYKK